MGQATTHQEISAVQGFAVGEPSHRQGWEEKRQGMPALRPGGSKAGPKGSVGIALTAKQLYSLQLQPQLQAATRPTTDKERRNISSCSTMDGITKTATVSEAAQQTEQTAESYFI
jgi:hypothetical protein